MGVIGAPVVAPPGLLPPSTCLPAHSPAHSLSRQWPWAEYAPSSARAQYRKGQPHTDPGGTWTLGNSGPHPLAQLPLQMPISSWAMVPTWLSWVPSPWAWAGSGHARQAHSSWIWLKQRLAVAAELLCLEEVSKGSSWESRRRPVFWGALDEPQYPWAWVLAHRVHIHSSLKPPLGLVP